MGGVPTFWPARAAYGRCIATARPADLPFERRKKPADPNGTGGLRGGNKEGVQIPILSLRGPRHSRLQKLAK
jgi:hypothetical protein